MEATDITDATCEKIVLMLLATPGITAPAATATKPAIQCVLDQVLAAGIAENPYLQNQASYIHFLPVVLGPSCSARVLGQLQIGLMNVWDREPVRLKEIGKPIRLRSTATDLGLQIALRSAGRKG